MLSQQDKQNILGWAYYWLRGQAEQTTKAAYCDVEAACCDDVAKVWFLIKLIERAQDVFKKEVCIEDTETITVEGNPASLTITFIQQPLNSAQYNGFIYGSQPIMTYSDTGETNISTVVIGDTLEETADSWATWFNLWVAANTTNNPNGITLSAIANGNTVTITTSGGTTWFNGESNNFKITDDGNLFAENNCYRVSNIFTGIPSTGSLTIGATGSLPTLPNINTVLGEDIVVDIEIKSGATSPITQTLSTSVASGSTWSDIINAVLGIDTSSTPVTIGSFFANTFTISYATPNELLVTVSIFADNGDAFVYNVNDDITVGASNSFFDRNALSGNGTEAYSVFGNRVFQVEQNSVWTNKTPIANVWTQPAIDGLVTAARRVIIFDGTTYVLNLYNVSVINCSGGTSVLFLSGGTDTETETITTEVCEFVPTPELDILYMRLQCLIGLNTVTACPANCFPCTPVDPPVPPPTPTQQCTVIVGDGCCRYSAQNCKLNNYEAWVCLTLPEELVPVGEVGRLTITIFNITKIFSAITQPLSRLVIIQELINLAEDIGYGWYTTADGICIYQAENFDDALPIAFTTYVNGEPSGSFTQGISSVVSFCGNFYKGEIVTENAQEIIYDAPEYYTTKVEVLINSVWVDVTDEVETGAWTREEFCDGVISEWRVLDNEDNVVGSGIFNVECGGEEVTKTPCEWLQEHQTAIEQLQNKKCTIVKEICCDYTVEDIELCEKSCLEITFPDVESLNFSTPPPLSPTGFFAISIGNEGDDVSNGVSYIGVEGNILLSEIFESINNISSQYATFVFDGNKLTISNTDCYYDTIVFAYGITTGTINPSFDSFIVQSCNEQELEQVFNPLTGALIGYIMRLRKYRFEVLINGVWTDLTDDVVNGTWQRSSCNDTITQWRTIFPSGNDVGYIIIETGNVQSVCTPTIETGTPCELLQDLQDEINALEVAVEELQNNPSTNPTLQSVTDEGNTTDNNIQFGAGAGVFFDNGSRVTEGTTNAGNGGNGGVAMRCSVDYELKWEAGRLYVMEQDGFSIREVSHNFNITPTVNDDDTLGYFVGSRWILDDGTVYVCSDASTGAAVWALAPSQVNADWNATSGVAEILNKPSIPTAVSQLSNDSGYQTASQVTNAIANAKPVTVVGVDATANALTGSVTNGVLGSILIPANTMTTNTIVELEAFLSKASSSASPTHRVWINNANNITGATQIALQTGATATQMSKMERTFIVTSTGLTIYPTTASANIDDNVANAAPTNVSVNWTVNQWLLHTANNASGETTTNVFLYAKKAQP